MQKSIKVLTTLALTTTVTAPVLATNGDNLIAIGPNARSMGGVGIAAPQDAISAVFGNPAAMCYGPFCPASEFNFAGTVFMPKIKAEVTGLSPAPMKADSHDHIYPIPAIGFSAPIGKGATAKKWRFGLAAYGVSGLGVDYRDTALDSLNTSLQIMKFAPSLAYQPTRKWSVGVAMHVDYATLDLGQGSAPGWGIGAQPGVIFRPSKQWSIGLTYTSPQNVDHKRVFDFDGVGGKDTLQLEAPQQIGLGVAYTLMENRLLLEVDGKWINWGDANGYEDFDWQDQWVVGVGAKFQIIPNRFSVRAGYNYGNNPVNEHNGWEGTNPKSIQGKALPMPAGPTDPPPTLNYEMFRILGFPAIVEHHIGVGLGYAFSERFSVDAGYVYAFGNDIKESGTVMGNPVTLKSTLSEHSIDFGLNYRF